MGGARGRPPAPWRCFLASTGVSSRSGTHPTRLGVVRWIRAPLAGEHLVRRYRVEGKPRAIDGVARGPCLERWLACPAQITPFRPARGIRWRRAGLLAGWPWRQCFHDPKGEARLRWPVANTEQLISFRHDATLDSRSGGVEPTVVCYGGCVGQTQLQVAHGQALECRI